MKIILLERVAKLGQMGEVVKVRDGFARNYLLPQGKALRATKVNQQRFDTERAQLEARNLERKSEAEGVAKTLDGQSFTIIRQAGETGQLYGSVSTRDIADVMTEGGFSSARSQVRLDRPIKTIGLHDVTVVLHPEVEVSISLNIARSADEAERQARGEDLTGREQDIFEFEEDEDEDEDAEGDDADGETSADAGEEASEEIGAVAEGGDISSLNALLEDNYRVADTASSGIAEINVANSNIADGMSSSQAGLAILSTDLGNSRFVQEAYFAIRNRVDATTSVLTVYATDDVTSSWTASIGTAAQDSGGINSINPQ